MLLAAASIELMAMVTAVFKGMKNVFYSVGKTLSGILGGIASCLLIPNEYDRFIEKSSDQNHSTILKSLLGVKIVALFLTGTITPLIGLSYHVVWCRQFLTTRATFWMIRMLGKKVGVQKMASMAALRLALWRIVGLLGVIIMGLDIAVTLLSDDNLETWLKRCALRTNKYLMPHNKIRIYQTSQQQTEAFEKEVLNGMFDINANPPKVNNKASRDNDIDIDEALALIEQDMDEREFLDD